MSGVYTLAIDTSPASMKVSDDSIADRGDAFHVFTEETTTGRGLASSGPCQISASCDQNGTKYQMDFNILPFFYEATAGESYRKGGVPESSIFTEEAMEYIREFENNVLNLPWNLCQIQW